MFALPTLPPFFCILFSLFPAYIWWVKQYPHVRLILGFSFFSMAFGFIFPSFGWGAFILGLILTQGKIGRVDHPHRALKFKNRWIRFPLEALGVWMVYLFFKILPLKMASDIGGYLGRFLGPKIKGRQKLALRNLNHVFPYLKNPEEVIAKMWENFGRTVGEMPHLKKLSRYTKRINFDVLEQLRGRTYIIAIGHFNSLGLLSKPFRFLDEHAGVFFRSGNNPLTTTFLKKAFGNEVAEMQFFSKDREGVAAAVASMQQGHPIAIASDLHIKGGEKLDFLGKPAETSVVLAKLAKRFSCPIVPVQIIRTQGLHHEIRIHPALSMDNKSLEDGMQRVNTIIGDWVKEAPDQWFWINNRWNL